MKTRPKKAKKYSYTKDCKVDPAEVKKLDTFVNEEVEKLKKDIKYILDKNDEMNTNLKNTANENQEIISKNLENKLNGDIAQIENKMAIIEASRQDTTTKLTELLKKNDKINEDLVNLSSLKSKFESKVNTWDSKADPAEVKKLDTFVNEEVEKLKKDIKYILDKNDEMSANLKNTSNENQETTSKNLENKLTGNIAQIENKMAIIEGSRKDTATKLTELLKKNEKMHEDLVNLSSLKSNFESKVNTWDGKADPADIKKLDTFVNKEVEKLKKNIEFILQKNDEISGNLKTTIQNENEESASKDLEKRLTGSIAKIENKLAVFESSRQETTTKLSELLKKNEKINEDLVNVSGLKSKFDSKVNIWDSKADPAEVKKLNTFVNEEVKKLKKDIEYISEKNDELSTSLKNTLQNENQEKNLENKFIKRDEFKTLDLK